MDVEEDIWKKFTWKNPLDMNRIGGRTKEIKKNENFSKLLL